MAFFITNGQAVPIWVNHSYEVISGLSARDVLGIPMDELVRRGLISNSATLQALEIGHSYTANQSFVTGKQALVTSTPIYNENDQVCLVVTNVRDISNWSPSRRPWTSSAAFLPGTSRRLRSSATNCWALPKWWPRTPPPLNLLRIVGRAAQLDTVILIQGETGAGKERIASYIHQHSPGPEELHPGQLRCHPREFGRKRTLRLRAGCLHRRQPGGKASPLRGGQRGHHLPGRGGGTLPGHPNQAPPGPPGAGTHPGGGAASPSPSTSGSSPPPTGTCKNASPRAPSGRTSTTASASFPSASRPCGAEVDIPKLARSVIDELNQTYEHKKSLTPGAEALLLQYNWPGNVRELRNVMERAFIMSDGEQIQPQDLAILDGSTLHAPRTISPTYGAPTQDTAAPAPAPTLTGNPSKPRWTVLRPPSSPRPWPRPFPSGRRPAGPDGPGHLPPPEEKYQALGLLPPGGIGDSFLKRPSRRARPILFHF